MSSDADAHKVGLIPVTLMVSIAVKLRRGVQVVVVVIQPGVREALRLRFTQRAQRHTRLQPHRFYPLHHLFQVRHCASGESAVKKAE